METAGIGEPWTKKEVAAFLRCDVRTVDRLGIPRVEVKGRGTRPLVRYDSEQVRAWWARRVEAANRAREARPAGTVRLVGRPLRAEAGG